MKNATAKKIGRRRNSEGRRRHLRKDGKRISNRKVRNALKLATLTF